MRVITTLAIVAVLAASAFVEAAAPSWYQLGTYTFDQYERDFGRNYPSVEERARREEIFNMRMARIRKHNADRSATYKKGVNQFSDWSDAEFRDYNKAKPHMHKDLKGIWNTMKNFNANGAIIPGAVDHRRANPPVLTAVKNQGHCGSCWAHSTIESIESYFAIAFGQLPVLSVEQVTACDNNMYGCGGGDALSGFNYVSESKGLYEEWEYPYTEFFAQNMSKAATAACKDITKEYFPNWAWVPKANVTGMWAVEANNATATMEALALHGPLSISVGAGDWSEYESGIFFNTPNSTVQWEIDHAVQMVGYGFDDDMQMGYWIVRNSWGTTWGESGFIRLWRPVDKSEEPCGTDPYGNQKTCGTSGCLNGPSFPDVAMLQRKN